MKPAYLKRHLETKYAHFSTKPAESFQAKRNSLKQQQKLIIKTATVAENVLKASYAVSQRIAKCKKAHKIAESLIIPAAVDICKIMFRAEQAKKVLKKYHSPLTLFPCKFQKWQMTLKHS